MYFPIPASAKQFVMSDMRLIVARRPVVFHEFDERKARRVLDRKRKDKASVVENRVAAVHAICVGELAMLEFAIGKLV